MSQAHLKSTRGSPCEAAKPRRKRSEVGAAAQGTGVTGGSGTSRDINVQLNNLNLVYRLKLFTSKMLIT
jgi:hypothetical protein